VLDEAALLQALDTGRLAGAGLDVLCGELDGPIADHPLVQYARTHRNLIITPHMGGVTYESQEKAVTFTMQKVKRFVVEQGLEPGAAAAKVALSTRGEEEEASSKA